MIFKRVVNDINTRFPTLDGKTCRYCKKTPLPKRRSAWCSDACALKAIDESYWPRVRLAVYKRDKGLCQAPLGRGVCGFDIGKMMEDLRAYMERAVKQSGYREAQRLTSIYAATMYGARARNWPLDCWAADHIRPISEGGECLDKENARLVDLVCHDALTAALRKRLSERRKRHRFLPLFTETP